MTQSDFRLLCTALGFTVVLLRGDKLQAGERAARTHGIAALIEAFSRDVAEPALIDRMAAAITALGRGQAVSPQDLIARDFTAEEVDRHWTLAKALATLEETA